MDKTVNYPQLLEKLASEDIKNTNVTEDRRKIIKSAKEKFTIWADRYANIVSQMVEKWENNKAESSQNGNNLLTPNITTIRNEQERPTADPAKIIVDIIDNWYRCLVWTVNPSGSRKARRKIWSELTEGKFTTPTTASMLRDALKMIKDAYN